MITPAVIIKASTLLGAIVALGGAAWAVGEYTETRPVVLKEFKLAQADSTQVLKGLIESQSQMTTSLMELQYQTLTLKRKSGALDFYEEQTRCRIAKKLDYTQIEGCD